MDPERWQRIKAVFSAALELPAGQRAAWVAAALPDDPALAGEVESLLAAHDDETHDLFERGALAAVPDVQRQLEGAVEGTRVGPYRILAELGRGGMGAVYLAVRDEPGFKQKVALKLIKRGMDTDEIVRRFLAERQILAALVHPNIARLYDGGSTPDGRPYFAMEYVEGQPITAWAAEHELSIEARLHLFLKVCRAVQHAHQSLVVHRDLKPANILVDAEGEPKLLDFGIAKLLDPGSFGRMTSLTGLSPSPMTPEYASPEQRDGGPVTTATDVYGLGLLLYELLVGQSLRAIARILDHGRGDRWIDRPPSQALAALTAAGDAETRRRARRLSGDLDTIVAKALEPAPERRYGTAAALAEDIECHLTQRPVSARRPTLTYRLSRTLVRHKLAAALALAIVLFAVGALYHAWTVRSERDRAKAERERAEAVVTLLQKLIQQASPAQSRRPDLPVREVLDSGAEELLGRNSRYQPETWALLLETTGTIYRELGLYDQARKNLQRALELRQPLSASREGALALAGTLTTLGDVSLDRQAYAEGRVFYQRALTLKERRFGPNALALAKDLNGLATAFLEEGNLHESERLFKRACEISRLDEDGARDLAECYNNLGALAERQGDFARERFLLSAAFHYFRSNRGEDHPETILVRRNLATVLARMGDAAGAEAFCRENVAAQRRVLEPNHPDLAESLLYLAIAQHHGGHLAEARATLDELLAMRRRYRFPRDQSEAESWALAGALERDRKNLAAADAAFAKSYEVYQGLAGEHRANLSRILNSRARLRLLRGDSTGALGLARRSVQMAQASSVGSDEAVAMAESVLGLCYLESRQPANARPLLERSYQALLEIYGPEHSLTQAAEGALRRLGPAAN